MSTRDSRRKMPLSTAKPGNNSNHIEKSDDSSLETRAAYRLYGERMLNFTNSF